MTLKIEIKMEKTNRFVYIHLTLLCGGYHKVESQMTNKEKAFAIILISEGVSLIRMWCALLTACADSGV